MGWKFYNSSGQLLTSLADIVSTGALNSGSITSGFGTIDTGSSTLGSGAITSTGTVTATGFTIGSAAITEAELEILDGATVTTTELNLIDGGTGRGTTAVASGDGILINDAGTMAMTNVDTVSTYFASHSVGGGNIVTVGTIGTGTWQGGVIAEAYLPNAGLTAQGVVELATAAETTAGTSATLAVTPDSLSQSVVFGTRYVQCVVVDSGTDIAEGDGKFFFHVPAGMDTMELIVTELHARVATAGSGSTVDVQLFLNTSTTNASTGNDMLSTSLTIDDGELDSSNDSAPVVNASYKEVNTNDMIRIDVDGNGGDSTIAKGLIVTMGFRLPD